MRPPKRLNVVSVRLNEDERASIDELAEEAGETVGAVLRRGLMALKTQRKRRGRALTKLDRGPTP